MNNLPVKIGRRGRKVTTDNYRLIMTYFARQNVRLGSPESVLLNAFALEYKHSLHLFGSSEEIETKRNKLEALLQHHIKNLSPDDMINRFQERVSQSYRRIPITLDMLNDLQLKVKTLSPEEWQRCANWIKQKRKRESDKSTNAEKRTIKVSTPIFEALNNLKLSMNEATWDQLFTEILAKYEK